MENWNESILAATQAYARITKRGRKWHERRIPVYIRENLLVPYYLTVEGRYVLLHTIQYPENEQEKVRFEVAARSTLNETTKIFTIPKQARQD